MNPAFAADTAAIFQGPLSVEAQYTPTGGSAVPIRCIPELPDAMVDYGQSRLTSQTASFLIQVAAVAAPREGDQIEASFGTYIVQGVPKRNSRRLFWRVEAVPEAQD